MGIMRSISRGVALAGAAIAGGALAVTASSVLATPQPLENALEGESHIFRFRAGDLFYTVRGPADAPPVLLLHSVHLSASSFEWRKNFHALSQHFRVYAPDLLGFGLSDRPAIAYTPDFYIHLITDFAREVIARPTIVVARNHSAPFAVRAAALDSHLFTRLVFISPTGILPPSAEESRDWAARSGDALQRVLRSIGDNTAGQVPYAFLTTRPALSWLIARQSYANPEYATPEVVDHLFATTHQYGARFAPLAFMSGQLDIDVAGDYAALQQPILLVWGAQDAITHPTHAEALTRLNPHARLELIEQAGNAVQEEQAEEVNELLHAWCLAPTELVDPTFREQPHIPAPPAPVEQVTHAAPATTAAPLTTPLPETTLAATEEKEETTPTYAEAPRDETAATATPPAASPEAAPAPFATADTKTASAATEEESAEAAPQPPKREAQRRAPARGTGTRSAAPGRSSQSRSAQPTEHDSAHRASPASGDKPQPPRSSGGPRKKS